MEYNIDDLKIRLMKPEDREGVVTFFSKLGEEGGNFFNRGRGNERGTMAFFDGKCPDREYWVAVAETDKGEEIAGLCFIWRKDSGVPWFGIGITEEWKGRHLGRRLIATAREYCEQHGCGGIMLTTAQTNYRGQGLYEHCGFEKLGIHSSGEFLYLLTFRHEAK